MTSNPILPNRWKRHPENPLLSLRPGKFDANHIHAPMVILEGGLYRMWYSGSDREKRKSEYHRIGYAESRDGVHWELLDEPILVPTDPLANYTTPAILREAGGEVRLENGVYKMWFTGNNLTCDLHLATSSDGIDWNICQPDPLCEEVYCPTVIFEDGLYKMWYTYLTGEGVMAIFYGTSTDGLSWDLHQDKPVLESTEPWEYPRVLYPFVLKRSGVYEMYYTSYGSFNERDDSRCDLALAHSEDGIHWQKGDAPILSPDPASTYDSVYCFNASVIVEPDGRDKMYYASRVDKNHKYYAIGLAVREL